MGMIRYRRIAAVAAFVSQVATADSSGGPVCLPDGQLPFYQPVVVASDVDEVVLINNDTPTENRFRVRTQWLNGGASGNGLPRPWSANWYTGFSVPYPFSDFQRGQSTAANATVTQVQDARVGMWLNSTNTIQSDGGYYVPNSGYIDMGAGCWLQSSPVHPFSRTSSGLRVSFDLQVKTWAMSSGSNAFVRTDLFLRDTRSGTFVILTVHPFATSSDCQDPKTDLATGSSHVDGWIVGTGYDTPCNRITRRAGVFQSTPGGASQIFDFDVTPANLTHTIEQIYMWAAMNEIDVGELSLDPADYELIHFVVAPELYIPVRIDDGTNPLGGVPYDPFSFAQIGMNVGNYRVISTIPHVASGTAWGAKSNTERVDYVNSAGHLMQFWRGSGDWLEFNVSNATGAPAAVGNSHSFVSSGAVPRSVFRTSAGHVVQTWMYGGWNAWDMSGLGGFAAGDPFGYSDTSGAIRVLFRDSNNRLVAYAMHPVTGNWSREDISLGTPGAVPLLGEPTGFDRGDGVPYVVYRGNGGMGSARLYQHWLIGGVWGANFRDLTTHASGAVPLSDPFGFSSAGGRHIIYRASDGVRDAYESGASWQDVRLSDNCISLTPASDSRPVGFVGSDGNARVVFRALNGHVALLTLASTPTASSTTCTDLSQTLGARAAKGNPTGYLSDGVMRIVYTAKDDQLHEIRSSGSGWVHFDY